MRKKSVAKSSIGRRAKAIRILMAAGYTDQAISLGQAPPETQSELASMPKKAVISNKPQAKEATMKGSMPSASAPDLGLSKKLGQNQDTVAKKPNSRVEVIRISDCSPCEAREKRYRHIIVKPSAKPSSSEAPDQPE